MTLQLTLMINLSLQHKAFDMETLLQALSLKDTQKAVSFKCNTCLFQSKALSKKTRSPSIS